MHVFIFAHTSLHRAVSSVNAGLIIQERLHLRIAVDQFKWLSRPHEWFEHFRKFREEVEFTAKIVNHKGQVRDPLVIILCKKCPHRIDANVSLQEAPGCCDKPARKNVDLTISCVLQMVMLFNDLKKIQIKKVTFLSASSQKYLLFSLGFLCAFRPSRFRGGSNLKIRRKTRFASLSRYIHSRGNSESKNAETQWTTGFHDHAF